MKNCREKLKLFKLDFNIVDFTWSLKCCSCYRQRCA